MFIAIEGTDGSGKSTQAKLLVENLKTIGLDAVHCVDPGGTELGQKVRNILLDLQTEASMMSEALLFMASRAQLLSEVMYPAGKAGKAVVSDRFVLSNIVYQGYAGGLNLRNLRELVHLASDYLVPDLTVVLDVPLELMETRRKGYKDRIECRGKEYYEKVRNGFLRESRLFPNTIVVDGNNSEEKVQEQIFNLVCRLPVSADQVISSDKVEPYCLIKESKGETD